MPQRLPNATRRALLLAGLAAPLWPAQAEVPALPRQTLQFPRDLGSHPDFAIEWWYLTGHLRASQGGGEWGFQVTFFRSRVAATQAMRSAFAAKQLLFAHAAVTDVASQTLWHDQRAARTGFGLAQASERDTDVRLRDWSLVRQANHYRTQVSAEPFTLDLALHETQPLLLQGQQGLSRKGPDASQASYYYSLPQLRVQGALTLQGQAHTVQGTAWLDHEWSQALLHPQAVGWDWIGMNLDDGGALTAFRLRTASGQALWAGGSFRAAGGAVQSFGPESVRFEALRHWVSPLSQTRYPVAWQVDTPVGRFTVHAVVDAQELDSRASTGAIYWEGLSDLRHPSGARVGRGYLEMTGYASALRL